MRSRSRSRYYIDVPVATRLEDWPEDRLWDELACRLGPDLAARITRGPAIALSLAPLRSFVCEPMRHGRLLLCGDAAHIVPPTGAKGLNLAANDVRLAAEALTRCFRHGDGDAVAGYSARALAQVWKAQRFSWYLTRLLHRHPDDSGFDDALQSAELAHIRDSHAARLAIAQAYLGQ
jgi:p-hydroxybenzoate 3-monooxygenase